MHSDWLGYYIASARQIWLSIIPTRYNAIILCMPAVKEQCNKNVFFIFMKFWMAYT